MKVPKLGLYTAVDKTTSSQTLFVSDKGHANLRLGFSKTLLIKLKARWHPVD